MCKLAAV